MGHGAPSSGKISASYRTRGGLSCCRFLTLAFLMASIHGTAEGLQNDSGHASVQAIEDGSTVEPVIFSATAASIYASEWARQSPPVEEVGTPVVDNASSRHSEHLSPPSRQLFCVPPSIDEFPRDPFTQEQRLGGWLAVHFTVLAYLCCMLAIVCDEYFVPCLERISDALKISSDVAGATVMAVGTSSPELYSAIIGSFVTEGDIGVGTIVGSAVFNILGVTSVTGVYLLSTTVQLEWYPIVRDCLLYVASVSVLAACLSDSTVHWYEAASLLALFCVYVLVMHYNPQLKRLAVTQVDELVLYIKSKKGAKTPVRSKASSVPAKAAEAAVPNHGEGEVAAPLLQAPENTSRPVPVESSNGLTPVMPRSPSHARRKLATEKAREEGSGMRPSLVPDQGSPAVEIAINEGTEVVFTGHPEVRAMSASLHSVRSGARMSGSRRGCVSRAWWVVSLPASLVLRVTVPDCRRWPRLFPLTFLMAVVWIGLLSYMCAWMVTVIGYTLNVPDSVSGITIMAAGISVPEIITTVLIVKMGFGNMAFSNLIGSNIFDILFCLGLPWLAKTLSNSGGRLHINSGALTYTTLTLLATTVLMLVTLCAARWRLNWRVGLVCLALYAAFLTLACLYELNYFGPFNPPTCKD